MDEKHEVDKEIKILLENCESQLSGIISKLGWSKESILALSTNGFNDKKVVKKIETKDDPFFPPSFGCVNSVVINENIIHDILQTNKKVPNKFSELQTNFNSAEKIKLYEFVKANTSKKSDPIENFMESSWIEKKQSFAEILAKEKNEKKRVRKFRTSKPTHIEEVRSLIDIQMQALKQYLHPKNSIKKRVKSLKSSKKSSKKNSKRSRRSRSSDNGKKRKNKSKNRNNESKLNKQ